ncbi:MAG: hypothetical protein PHE10_01105, partial [Kiritimatiellae bacterium]|nr:hypothetical protein [Kiritimatiellia bacterium]
HIGGGLIVSSAAEAPDGVDCENELVSGYFLAVNNSGGLGLLGLAETRVDGHESHGDYDREESPKDTVTDKAVEVINEHGFISNTGLDTRKLV